MNSEFDSRRKRDVHFLVSIFFASSLALGDYGIRFYVYVLKVSVEHPIVAAFTEPITTKLLPALAVVWVHYKKDVPLEYLQSRPYWFAFLGGLSLGIFERILYIVVKGATISPGFILAPGIHAVNALLIAGLVFKTADEPQGYRFFAKLLGITILAIAIHLFWNTWGVVLVYRAFS